MEITYRIANNEDVDVVTKLSMLLYNGVYSKNAHTYDELYESNKDDLNNPQMAMLVALHIEPDKKKALPLLDEYYRCLCENAKDYPYEVFLNDYKIAIMENMFFTIRLLNRGIYDFKMRDKAIRAFETFVLEK